MKSRCDDIDSASPELQRLRGCDPVRGKEYRDYPQYEAKGAKALMTSASRFQIDPALEPLALQARVVQFLAQEGSLLSES